MKMYELEQKANQIEELEISQYNKNMYVYQTNTDNEEIKAHLKKVINNIELEDMYIIPGTNKWIKKDVIDNIVNVIRNATHYEEINEENLGNLGFINFIEYFHHEDMTTRAKIYFNNSNYRNELRKLIEEKINELDGIQTVRDGSGFFIDSEKIDQREQCKHTCKAQYRIKKINEIFEL